MPDRFKKWKIETGEWFDWLSKNIKTVKNKWIKFEKWIRKLITAKSKFKRIMQIIKWINNMSK